MKKVLLLLAFLPLLFACSSDDDSSSSNESNIVGVWMETFYWDRTDWHTWGFVSPPVWEFKADKTYLYYDSVSDYKSGKSSSKGDWSATDDYLSTGMHARKYSLSADKKTLTWEHVAILERY